MIKYSRNEQCWCLSGKKFKNCHILREKQHSLTENDKRKLLQEQPIIKICMHPEQESCQGKIVSAHSIQKSISLDKIKDDYSRVYECSPKTGPFEFRKAGEELGSPVLVSINKASTFYGFCKKHDNELFNDVENAGFNSSDPYHYFLFA